MGVFTYQRNLMIGFIFLLMSISGIGAEPHVNFLKAYPVETIDRFDLSGIRKVDDTLRKAFGLKGDWLLISDKSSFVYEGFEAKGKITFKEWIDLRRVDPRQRFDLEGIDSEGDQIFVVNEGDGTIYRIRPPSKIDLWRWKPRKSQDSFDAYFGIEGLATNGNSLFLTKEMPPLVVFEMPLKSWGAPHEAREIYRRRKGSQTDMRIRDGVTYILDRDSRCIWMMKPKADEFCISLTKTLNHADFDFVVRDFSGNLRSDIGTAEALEIEGNRLWVGLDNNGMGLKARPEEKRPFILEFSFIR